VKNISSQLFKHDVKDTFYTQSNRFACDTLFRLTSLSRSSFFSFSSRRLTGFMAEVRSRLTIEPIVKSSAGAAERR